MADTRTIAQVIAEIEAALARCEAMVEELKGKAAQPEQAAEAAAEAGRTDDAALAAEDAARLLDEVSKLFCNAPATFEPFGAPSFIKDAMRAAIRRLADCREHLAGRVDGERLGEVAPCDRELLFYKINVWGAPSEGSLLRDAKLAASEARAIADAARGRLKSRRARKGVANTFNAVVVLACRLRDYIIGDEQGEAAA